MNDDHFIERLPNNFVNSKNVVLRKACDTIFNIFVLTPEKILGACCGLSKEEIPELNLDWKKYWPGKHLKIQK